MLHLLITALKKFITLPRRPIVLNGNETPNFQQHFQDVNFFS